MVQDGDGVARDSFDGVHKVLLCRSGVTLNSSNVERALWPVAGFAPCLHSGFVGAVGELS